MNAKRLLGHFVQPLIAAIVEKHWSAIVCCNLQGCLGFVERSMHSERTMPNSYSTSYREAFIRLCSDTLFLADESVPAAADNCHANGAHNLEDRSASQTASSGRCSNIPSCLICKWGVQSGVGSFLLSRTPAASANASQSRSKSKPRQLISLQQCLLNSSLSSFIGQVQALIRMVIFSV